MRKSCSCGYHDQPFTASQIVRITSETRLNVCRQHGILFDIGSARIGPNSDMNNEQSEEGNSEHNQQPSQ